MGMIRCLEDDEIERELKWRGTIHFRVFQQVPYKGEIQLHDAGGEACIFIKQITTNKVCTLNFTVFKNKYLGLCLRFY
jgi:hypothetical protein